MVNERKSVQQLLNELTGGTWSDEEEELSSDQLEDTADILIRQSLAREKLIATHGDKAYDYDDPEELLERTSQKEADQKLAIDGLAQDRSPSYRDDVGLDKTLEILDPDTLDKIPRDHRVALFDPDTLVDDPVDLSKPHVVRQMMDIEKRKPSFVWSTQKDLAAALRAQGYSAERIAILIKAQQTDVEDWLQNPIFRARVQANIDKGPELAVELGKAHAPLVMRKLLALVTSGTDAHKVQVQAIALFFKTIGLDGKQLQQKKKGDASEGRTVTDALRHFVDGVEYTITDSEGELTYDSAWQTVDRDVGASSIAAFIQAKEIAREEDARILGYSVSDEGTSKAVSSPTKIDDLSSPDDMIAFIQALDVEDWSQFDANIVAELEADPALVTATDDEEKITAEELLEMRLEDDDSVLAQFLRKKIREATWTPVLKLDPHINSTLQEKRRLEMRQYRARKKAGINLPRGRPKKILMR